MLHLKRGVSLPVIRVARVGILLVPLVISCVKATAFVSQMKKEAWIANTPQPHTSLLPIAAKNFMPQPPIIEIPELPPAIHVGETISITLNVYDLNNDPIQVDVTQQLGMGDRYAGKEYVTAQRLEELILGGNTIHVKAQYPGNYRLVITASDKDGETQRGVMSQ